MNSTKLPIVILIFLILVGGVSSSSSNSYDKNTRTEKPHTYFQGENRTFYEYHTVYNRLELLYYQKNLGANYNVNRFSEELSIIKNGSVDKNLEENPTYGASQLFNNGPMNSAWPMASHDVRHTGRSPYNTTGNPDDVEKWRFGCDEVYGGPVLDKNGSIYFGSYDTFLYALYPNGTLRWKTEVGTIESTPALDENGIIYIGTIWFMNRLYALYTSNGTVKWSYYVGDDIDSSPAIGTDGTIYFGDWGGWIHALYPNGTLKWQYHTGNIVTSSPAISPDGTIYCGSHDCNLYAFYPNNGTVKWIFHTGDWVRVSPCVGEDGTVYCVSLDSYLYAIYPNNGTMKWKAGVGAGTNPTIGPDGTIYAGWKGLRAINSVDGSVKWTLAVSGAIEGSTPCTSHEGIIYFGTTGGDVFAVNPNGTVRWRNTYESYESPPAIGSDGTLYIGSLDNVNMIGHLRAFGMGEPKKIKIQSPEPGKIYFFGQEIGYIPRNNTLIIGSVTVKVQVYSENDIESIHFWVGGVDQYNVSKPPFEWNMNHRYGKWPLMRHTITVVASYKGGCSWTESILMWYFHFFKNF